MRVRFNFPTTALFIAVTASERMSSVPLPKSLSVWHLIPCMNIAHPRPRFSITGIKILYYATKFCLTDCRQCSMWETFSCMFCMKCVKWGSALRTGDWLLMPWWSPILHETDSLGKCAFEWSRLNISVSLGRWSEFSLSPMPKIGLLSSEALGDVFCSSVTACRLCCCLVKTISRSIICQDLNCMTVVYDTCIHTQK